MPPGSGFDAAGVSFGVEYLPGQYDQRADSAAQCVELVTGVKPAVRCAKFYVLQTEEDGGTEKSGGAALDEAALQAVQSYLVNPVDSRLVPEGE